MSRNYIIIAPDKTGFGCMYSRMISNKLYDTSYIEGSVNECCEYIINNILDSEINIIALQNINNTDLEQKYIDYFEDKNIEILNMFEDTVTIPRKEYERLLIKSSNNIKYTTLNQKFYLKTNKNKYDLDYDFTNDAVVFVGHVFVHNEINYIIKNKSIEFLIRPKENYLVEIYESILK